MRAAVIGSASGVGLASPLPGPRAGIRRAALAPRPAPRICGGGAKGLSRPALAIAAMAAPPLPAAMAAAAGGGGALGTFALAAMVMAALLALASSWRRSMSDLSKIPGPRQLPLLGNLIELGHPQAHQTLVELANRFGSLMRWAVLERLGSTNPHPGAALQACIASACAVLAELINKTSPTRAHQLVATRAHPVLHHVSRFKLLKDSLLITDPAEIEAVLARRGADELPKPAFIYTPLDPVGGWALLGGTVWCIDALVPPALLPCSLPAVQSACVHIFLHA